MPTIEPYEVLMRRSERKWALHARSLITLEDGTVVEGKPVPLNGLTDPAFTEVAALVGASKENEIAQLTAERDSLQTALTQLQADYDAKVNDIETKHFQIQSLTEKVAVITAERDARPTQEQLAAANARIAELEAQLNPANPFPDADWSGFKFAILSDPAIDRVAQTNPVSWPLMVLYLSQLDTNPARGPDIAQLWNFMEAYTAIDATEVARINAISQQHGVPLHLNEEGQIVIPQ